MQIKLHILSSWLFTKLSSISWSECCECQQAQELAAAHTQFSEEQIGIAPYFETWFQSGCQWAHFLAKLHRVLPICDEHLLSQVCSKASCSSCRFLGDYCKVPLCSPKAWLDPLLHTAQKKDHILQREDQRSDFLHMRKKERKTDFIRQRQTWRVFAVDKCQCCCIELRRIQTKKKSHLFLLLSTAGRIGTVGSKQGSFDLLCFASPYGHTQLHCTDGVRRASRLSITAAPSASASDFAAALLRDFTGAAPSCSCSCFLFVFLFLGLFFL